MARKKQKGERKAAQGPAKRGAKKAERPAKPAEESKPPAVHKREIRPYVYAAFDGGMAVLWSVLLTTQLESRHGWANALLWGMVLMIVAMGVAMFVRNKWGWRVGALCSGVLLLLWVFLLVVLLLSASFLAGVYGAFGNAAASGVLVVAALSIELVALLPALQLKFLMTRAGRRHFGQEPLG